MKNLLNLKRSQNLDEIVFQDRNKLYGAYALRREEGAVLSRAMFLGIGLFVVLAITPVVVSGLSSGIVETPAEVGPPVWVLPPQVEKPDKEKTIDVQPLAQRPVQTYNTAVPTPTRNASEPPATVIDRDQAVPGLQDTPGEPPVTSYSPPVITPGPSVQPTVTPAQPADPNAVPTEVDIMADYQGGIQAFRKKVIQNLNGSAYEGSGDKITAVVTFIVERDGTLSAIKATGKDVQFNREAERSVTAAKGKWQPAVLDGQKVRSYFRIPITMQFD